MEGSNHWDRRSGFVMVYQGQDGVDALLSSSGLTNAQRLLCMALIGWMTYGNRVTLSQAEMARRLGSDQGAISRALAALEDAGFIIYTRGVGQNRRIINVSPWLAWKGDIPSEAKRRKAWIRWSERRQRAARKERQIGRCVTMSHGHVCLPRPMSPRH